MTEEQVCAHDMTGVIRIPIQVRWGDMDALRHVNNVAYFRYFEEARVQCLERLRVQGGELARAFVLAHASCDFLQPLFYPDTAVVVMALQRLGRSSITFAVHIERQSAPGEVVARGTNVLVGIDEKTGASTPWTEHERAIIVQCFQAENYV